MKIFCLPPPRFWALLLLTVLVCHPGWIAAAPSTSRSIAGAMKSLGDAKAQCEKGPLRKLDSKLWPTAGVEMDDSLSEVLSGSPRTPSSKKMAEVTTNTNGFVQVEIFASVHPDLINSIKEFGGIINFESSKFQSILATVPGSQLTNLIARADVYGIYPPALAFTNKIDVTEGVKAHRVDIVRQVNPELDGRGVKIGVLSDSVDYYEQMQASGDIPDFTILTGQGGLDEGYSGEGTAMLEIINDMAPGASLYFATAFTSVASFAQNILDLAAAGCKVIVDDVIYYSEPAFEDGPISKAINEVTEKGVLYFSAAGNEGSTFYSTGKVWEGDYNGQPWTGDLDHPDWPDGYVDFHLFGTQTYLKVEGILNVMTLQWASNFTSPDADFDLFLLDETGALTGMSTSQSRAYEQIQWTDSGTYYLVVARYGPSSPKFISLRTFGGSMEAFTDGQCFGHPSSAGAIAVAATPQLGAVSFSTQIADGTPLDAEPFSSQGPRRYFYDENGAVTPGVFTSQGGKIRNKPDITAADGVSVATPGFNPFYGTSAAAPHAAAIAAILLNVNPGMVREDFISFCANCSLDILGQGYDDVTGHGVLDLSLLLACALPTSIGCLSHPCQNGGTCQSDGGLLGYTCICAAGFTGPTCSEVATTDPCTPGPCQNGGTCAADGSSFVCTCTPAFTGPTCSSPVVLPCDSSPCKNGGSCDNSGSTFTCTCPPDFDGPTCENSVLDPCDSNSCEHGECVATSPTTFNCTCDPGFEGNLCQDDINECTSSPCLNNGACSNTVGSFSCSCSSGYTGPRCEIESQGCEPNPCLNGGTCVSLKTGDYKCRCTQGWLGYNCEVAAEDRCDSKPCVNGGTCFPQHGGSCACPPGFVGVNCEVPLGVCDKGYCNNGGQCVNITGSVHCVCPAGFVGLFCQYNLNECLSNPCKNGAVCENTVGSYVCKCPAGFTGCDCSLPQSLCTSQTCSNGGTCLEDDPPKCECPLGFTGAHCESEESGADSCFDDPCENGGICFQGLFEFHCICPKGFSGETCAEDVNECLANPCENGGTCENNVGSYSCVCPEGYSGKDCQRTDDLCDSNPCQNEGLCVPTLGSYVCICGHGFEGNTCSTDVNECDLGYCANGGTCANTAGSFQCECPPGFTGPQCVDNINECLENPCGEGATCFDVLGSYLCQCPLGFTGSNCTEDIDECLSEPCANGGTCTNTAGSFECACPSGYTGARCLLPLLVPCESNPCKNGGICRSALGHPVCLCTPGFSGPFCDQSLFNLTVLTGDVLWADSVSQIYITFNGLLGSSQQYFLGSDFARGGTNLVSFTGLEIGSLFSISLETTGTDAWYLSSITVNDALVFEYNNWITARQPSQKSVTLTLASSSL